AETIAEHDPITLEEVRFIAYADEDYEAVSRVADDVLD
ncbi:MAG: hypothetical protein ACI9EZ_000879, partial [Halobacteriales archaeon]